MFGTMSTSPHTPSNRPGRAAQRVRSGNRTLIACVNCKEKKLKCDNNIFGCENCRRFSFICLVEDPASKRHLPRNYVEILEQRVALLEGLLKQYRPDLANDHLLHDSAIQYATQSSIPDSFSETREAIDNDCDSYQAPSLIQGEASKQDGLDALASQVGLLSLNAAGAEPHYLGSSSTFAFSRLINSSLRQVVLDAPIGTKAIDNDNIQDTSVSTPCLLPDYDTAIKLSDAYFNNIHTQYPFLHEPTFRAWEGMVIGGTVEIDTLVSNPVPFYFLNMVYAIGALLLPSCGYSAERLYISAQMYSDHILARENLEAIQAILCCAVYSLRSSIGTSHWKLAGLALRQCIDLGYHRSVRHVRPTTNPLSLELRKRVFWCSYVIESQAAIMLGRPQGIPYQEVDAEYPLDIDDSYITNTGIHGTPRSSTTDSPTSMTRAIHTFKIRRLLGRIHGSIYSNVDPCCSVTHETCCSTRKPNNIHAQHLRAQIEEWRSLIPPATPCKGPVLALFGTSDWFDLEYYYAILQLYRTQIINNEVCTTEDVFLDCLSAAGHICDGYRRQFLGTQTSYTWTALHELFLAGLTYLHCLWTSPAARKAYRQGQVSNTCTSCTIVLVIIAERWNAAASFRDIFRTLADRTMTMMDDKADGKTAQQQAPSVEQQDWDEGDRDQWMSLVADTGIFGGFSGLFPDISDNNPWEKSVAM